jgi:hypothetical protein
MNRPFLVSFLIAATATALGAQDASQNSTYQGQSHPPTDDIIITTTIPTPKPSAGQPVPPTQDTQELAPAASADAPPPSHPGTADPAANFPAARANGGLDDGIVQAAPSTSYAPTGLNNRSNAYDPDGDMCTLWLCVPANCRREPTFEFTCLTVSPPTSR